MATIDLSCIFPLCCIQKNRTRMRLGWTLSYVSCIFVYPDLGLTTLFIGMGEKSIKDKGVKN